MLKFILCNTASIEKIKLKNKTQENLNDNNNKTNP